MQFNGKNIPVATVVIEVMGNLGKDGLGLSRKQDELPCDVQDKHDNVSQAYSIELDSFTEKFQERAPLELLSTKLLNKIMRMSPRKGEH